MVTIKCTNPQCPNPNENKTFDWDEEKHIDPQCRVQASYEPNRPTVVATCPHCQWNYTLYVICPGSVSGTSEGGLSDILRGVRRDDRRYTDIPLNIDITL